MKRYISILIVAALTLSLFACDTENGGKETDADRTTSQEVTQGSSDSENTSLESTDAPEETTIEASVATESEESNTEEKEDVHAMEYTEYAVNDDKSASYVLDKAVILKLGYDTAFIDGVRTTFFDKFTSPFVKDGEIYIALDFAKEQLDLAVSASETVTNEYGDSFVALSTVKKVYTETFTDSENGIIAIYRDVCPNASEEYASRMSRLAANKLALGNTFSAKMVGDRPVLTMTDGMLELSISKAKSGMEPWASAWEEISSRAVRLVNTKASPDTGKSAQAYRLAACKDMINARYLALAYLYTEDESYLDAALGYLMAYAEPMLGTDKYLDYSAATTDGQADIGLNIAAPLTTACDVYSLLYTHIDDADKVVFENWVKAEADLIVKGHKYWIKNKYYGEQYGNNHLTSHLMGIIAAAYVLEDDDLLAYAYNSDDNAADLLEMITRAILMEGDEVYKVDTDSDFAVGEIYDRYRVVQNNGFGYSLYHLKFLTHCSLMLYNHGIDTFAYYGENGEHILLSYLAYADYLIKNDITANGGHYSNDKTMSLESAYSMYSIAYGIYGDSGISDVIEAFDTRGVKCNENELFGATTPFLFAYLPDFD